MPLVHIPRAAPAQLKAGRGARAAYAMACHKLLTACIASCFLAACACEGGTFGERLQRLLDEDGDGSVSTVELTSAVAVWAPGKTPAEHTAIGSVAVQLMQERGSDRPNIDSTALFRPDERFIPVCTCLQRVAFHSVQCNDFNGDGLVDRSEVRQNQLAVFVLNAAVSQQRSAPPTPPAAAGPGVSSVSGSANAAVVAADAVTSQTSAGKASTAPAAHVNEQEAAGTKAADKSASNSASRSPSAASASGAATPPDSYWKWRSSSAENTRLSNTWIVPLMNDPRALLIWLRFFDSSSYLDGIDDEHVERTSLAEFALTWAFVPSYPVFRMVHKKMSAFSLSSPLGCDGDTGHNAHSEIDEALAAAAANHASCKGIADIMRQNRHLLCGRKTPAGVVFPKQATGPVTRAYCLEKCGGNSAECFSPQDSLHRSQFDANAKCVAVLKDSVEAHRRDALASVAVFFIFLKCLCEFWSFVTLVLWFRGVYRTPRFGTIWISSIAKHMLGTASAAAVMFYLLWHILPSLLISFISHLFLSLIWPLGCLLLAHGLIMHGVRPAIALIKAAPPRQKAPCCSPPFLGSARDADKLSNEQFTKPKLRGSSSRAMSPAVPR
jgi:hypothetical protein